MPRPAHLTLVPTVPVLSDLPTPKAVPETVQAEAENIRTRLTRALLPLSGHASTDVALARSKAELYAIATQLRRLARRVP